MSTCFWSVPINPERADPQLNYAFPDTAAIYCGCAVHNPRERRVGYPEGSMRMPRYQSLNSYNAATAMPTAVLNDISTAPDAGSRNTYLPGADRANEGARSYTASVLNEASPAEPKPNTLYAGVPGQDRISLLYRIYLPDNGRDLTGGVGLPEPELHLPGGQVLRGQDLCSAVGADNGILKPASLPLDTYKALRDQPGKPATFPSEQRASLAGVLQRRVHARLVPISANAMAHPSGWAGSTPTSTTATSQPKSTVGSAKF